MKKLSIFLIASFLMTGLILLSTSFKTLPPGQSASGQCGYTLNERVQQFSFHANKSTDGNVSGSWESNSPGQDCRTHGTITCMTILPDGKTAILSGSITQVAGECFGAVVGDPIWFKVQDNGEGANSAGDMFSDYYFFIGNCLNYNVVLHPIENGNIQVKP